MTRGSYELGNIKQGRQHQERKKGVEQTWPGACGGSPANTLTSASRPQTASLRCLKLPSRRRSARAALGNGGAPPHLHSSFPLSGPPVRAICLSPCARCRTKTPC